jgi:hypothetical protein
MNRYYFFHSAHGEIVDKNDLDNNLDYETIIKPTVYIPEINPNKKFTVIIKSKSLIGTTTESGINTNEIIKKGMKDEFIKKFIDYLRITIIDHKIEKVEVWDKTKKQWKVFYDEKNGKMNELPIPNIRFYYDTTGDDNPFKTGIVSLDFIESAEYTSFMPKSEWSQLPNIQDYNQYTPMIQESLNESSSDSHSESHSDSSFDQGGTMQGLVMGQNGGEGSDIGYLHHNNETISLLSTIYSMLPSEEYSNPQDVEITIFNSTCLYYQESKGHLDNIQGVQKLLQDFKGWSTIFIKSGDLLYELKQLISNKKKEADDFKHNIEDIKYFINDFIKLNNEIINDKIYQEIEKILITENKTYLEILSEVKDFLDQIDDKYNSLMGQFYIEHKDLTYDMLKNIATTKYLISEKQVEELYNFKVGNLIKLMFDNHISILKDIMRDYFGNYEEYINRLELIGFLEEKDDPNIVDMLENYVIYLQSEEKKYKNRLRIINELKRLDFPDKQKTKLRTRSRNIKKGGKKKKSKFK